MERSFFLGGMVNLFFVLSGYLITRILFSAKMKGVQFQVPRHKVIVGFWLRRAIRIFPLYYFALFVCMLLPVIGAGVRNNAASYFFYFTNLHLVKAQYWPPVTAHFWTLDVEEQFYLAWPFIIIFMPQRYLLKLFMGIIAAVMLLKIFSYYPSSPVPLDILTRFNIDAFAVGGILAYKCALANEKERQFITKCFDIIFYTGIPVCLAIIITKSYYFSFVYNRFLFAVFSMKIIERAITGYKNHLGKFLENRVVLYLGKISYGIYIWHLLIPVLFWRLFDLVYGKLNDHFPSFFINHQEGLTIFDDIISSDTACFIIYSALTITASVLSWNLIEKPFSKLKSFIPSTRQYASK
jgi:peptidoglycan/LPS O-acetylase OafA/YrhL